MKIAYSSFSQVAQNDELPYGCQGIRYSLKKICDKLSYQFGSYFKEPDVLLFEVPNMTSMVISHKACAKCCSMIKTAKKIILVGDDSYTYQNFKTLNGKIPFSLKGDNQRLISEVLDFEKEINKNTLKLILPLYGDSKPNFYKGRIINFDYSHLHDYQNLYRPLKRQILSYSFKDKDNPNCEIIKGRELDCFKELCQYRICYMTDYGKNVPKNWVRNRYAQCYYANALMVGLKDSYFGNEFNVSDKVALSLSDKEFEEKVIKQKEIFKEKTKLAEEEISLIEDLFNE